MNPFQRVLAALAALAVGAGIALAGGAPAHAAASASEKKAFIASVVSAAQDSQRRYGVPASVSIAQAIVESDWGSSSLATGSRNFFNTRCSAGMTAAQFALVADAQVGKPYVLGAEASVKDPNPPKFDCSELVQWLFGRSGNPITDLAASQYNATTAVPKGTEPKPGDLVFLRNNPARSNGIGHVAVLTSKLDNGDWRIIEARGRAYGVVRSTLSYWKTRSYYAGLRRYAKLVFAGQDGITTSAASAFQSGCTTVSGKKYAKFASVADSFLANAIAVANDSAYRAVVPTFTSVPDYIEALAKATAGSNADSYAAKLSELVSTYDLGQYDVVPLTLVLDSGSPAAKVSALQNLLNSAGYSVSVSGKYDAATVAAVKKYQAAKKLETDGQAGPKTLSALHPRLKRGAAGADARALDILLKANGYSTGEEDAFGKQTEAALKDFQAVAGRPVTGYADANTWAALFMTLDPAPVPTVTGTPAIGKTLTVSTAGWSASGTNLAVQWWRDDAIIPGATKASYTVQTADAGASLTAVVTGTKPTYTPTRRISLALAVPLLKLAAAPAPKVSGVAEVGKVLTATPGTWKPAPVALTYQWFRGNTEIVGATKAAYTVQTADAGAKLTVRVTGTKTGYASITTVSAATSSVAQLFTGGTPTITGKPVVGETLTAESTGWNPKPESISLQWYRGTTKISGATNPTYVISAADAGYALTVKATAAGAGYSNSTVSAAPTTKVAKATLTTAAAKITGTSKVGRTLTASTTPWGPGTVKLTYQWYRSGEAIKGATKSTYKVSSSDTGRTIKVRVRGTKAGFKTADRTASTKIG